MSKTKEYQYGHKKQVVFADGNSDLPSTSHTHNNISQKSRTVRKVNIPTSSNRSNCLQPSKKTANIQSRRPSIKPNDDHTKVKQLAKTIQLTTANTTKEKIVSSAVSKTTEKESKFNKQPSVSAENESLNGTITSELGTMNKYRSSNNPIDLYTDDRDNEKQATLNLINKIKQIASPVSIGPMGLSQQACRFELPFDLKLLEILTPLDYLTKYCRLSSRRQYQFKRMFNKYRNKHHRFESSCLFLSISDIHQENFNHTKYADLCQLIDLGHDEHQFIFDTYAGILAFCERMLYNTLPYYQNYDDDHLAKDTIEQCDFNSLNRKLDGLIISDTMKRLLNLLSK